MAGQSVDWVRMRLNDIDEPLQYAREAADRVRHIVKDLKIFSRSDEEKLEQVDLARVMDSSIRMAWNEIRHRARLEKRYEDVPMVRANEARLGQVFLNLVINAAQSIPEGRASKNLITVTAKREGSGYVLVEVSDTGSGIPPNVLARVFDPFYTTKPIGVGTGLGLAICKRIVGSLDGKISVESTVGKGTTFRVLIPVAEEDAVAPTRPSMTAIVGPRGKVLVVDDEQSLGLAVKKILSKEHDVVALTNARDAVKQITAGQRYDVILSDLMMPEMTGMELYAELRKVAPDQADKLFFMTGDAFTSGAREFLAHVRNPRLEKPFETAALRALVHSMMR